MYTNTSLKPISFCVPTRSRDYGRAKAKETDLARDMYTSICCRRDTGRCLTVVILILEAEAGGLDNYARPRQKIQRPVRLCVGWLVALKGDSDGDGDGDGDGDFSGSLGIMAHSPSRRPHRR